TAPNYSLCAVLTCTPAHHPQLWSALHISANSVIAAPCASLRYSVHSSFLSGLLMRRKRRTLHDLLLLPNAFNIALQPVLVGWRKRTCAWVTSLWLTRRILSRSLARHGLLLHEMQTCRWLR